MKLSLEQLKTFEEDGYLFFPHCLSDEEVAVLRSEAESILRSDRKEVWREKTGAPRTAFAAHTYNEAFRLMAHHPRLLEPLQQFFGEGVYVHQFKINAKAAFEGDVWQWHQDYGTWARDDGMPQPRAMNISIFLDEVLPINGPLMLIPRSHKHGTLKAGHDSPPRPIRCGRSTMTPYRGWWRRRRRPAASALWRPQENPVRCSCSTATWCTHRRRTSRPIRARSSI